MADDRGAPPPGPTLPPAAEPPVALAPFHARVAMAIADLDAWGRDHAGRVELRWGPRPAEIEVKG